MTDATTWVEVSTGALARNTAAVARHAAVALCAVVKSNAYGHGLVECARSFQGAGARWLGVTRTEEARALRSAGIAGNILILTPPPAGLLAEAIGTDCSVALGSAQDVERFAAAGRAAGKAARIHLKVDTGMGRLGVAPTEAFAVARRIADDRDLALEGVWTHFASADRAPAQLARFDEARRALGRLASRAIVHAANSAATIAVPASRLDMVRVGTLLYGLQPPGVTVSMPLEPALAWFARVVAVHDVPAGGTVGYGSEWRAPSPARVATLAVGYGDGFGVDPAARSESLAEAAKAGARIVAVVAKARPSRRFVLFGDRRAFVVGRVGMQAITVRVDGLGVSVGDVARIPARCTLISPAIERVYVP